MRRAITVFFFLSIILSPIFGWVTGFRTELVENRTLAKMPEVVVYNLIDSKFYSDLGKFHNDRFPYRGWLIKAKNSIDFNLFKTSPSTKVDIGKDGWLFYVASLDDYLKNSCRDKELVRSFAQQLNELERALETSGRRLIFTVAPNKATIYLEYVRIERPENDCMKSRYDLLLEAFKEFPVKGFVRLDDLLIKAKNDYQVYERTGTHWNIYGAIIASRAILGRITSEWEEYMPELEISTTSQYKDLTNMVKIFGVWGAEEVPVLDSTAYIAEVSVVERDPLENGWPRLRITSTLKGEGQQLLPRTVMYRDSFMTAPLKIIQGSFEQVDALWTVTVPTNKAIEINELNSAEIVFIELVERNLGVMSIDVNKLTAKDPSF